ncbi:hypothetical protein [Wenxinia saemankumensis]|uniref:Divalent cation tolerance protein n=1 Tax=Wenxinia saemankumensis TaxID=1447782 RepID=A0A1M6E452_9RHOB|nr:hypothetical protein [Wenxinia saemankumensis]SHI80231.1 hypothetical protein SAMN05444417_1789 [Wenxinia saemankumensis]
MTVPAPADRYAIESGTILVVEVPASTATRVRRAIEDAAGLGYGDYDRVSFTSAEGIQRFRTLPTARNPATEDVVEARVLSLRVFLPDAALEPALRAIYATHPYEEPVILLSPGHRALHRRGLDEDNPNRLWNGPAPDWID